jgi:hypothetical protein
MRIIGGTHQVAFRHASKKVSALAALNIPTSTTTTNRPYSISKNLSINNHATGLKHSTRQMAFATTAAAKASFSSSSLGNRELFLQERGIFDHDNLLQFETLYELQSHASIAFSDNPLFGTYTQKGSTDEKGSFEWMSYKEYGEKVDLCRSVLSDLGKCRRFCIDWVLFFLAL